uniref:COGs COG3146 n=1 Tax=Rheinheimera sp. BAL341 TaxID=1708203 RepID=A0A486XWP7_9GAMM
MFTVRWLDSLTDISAAQWDAVFKASSGEQTYPFCQHAFLLALEQGGSVDAGHTINRVNNSGWLSQHLTLWQGDSLIAAVPGYIKLHSYGEYLFDWQIADAYRQFALPYYPKWIAAIPFTPATGPRLGVLPALAADAFDTIFTLICNTLKQALAKQQFYSVQWLYVGHALHEKLLQQGFLARHDVQFLWHNKDYQCFDDYLASLNSRKRKQVKQERSAVSGIKLLTLEGRELNAPHWQAIVRCYQATYLKRSGHQGYISGESFYQLGQTMPQQLVVFAALSSDDEIQAMALCFKSEDTLYGRHWGALVNADKLHFELCYYQGIEYCIKHGLKYFDAGAQGEHKLKRGFEPVTRYGSYLFADTPLSGAIEDYFCQEAEQLRHYQNEATRALPFKLSAR